MWNIVSIVTTAAISVVIIVIQMFCSSRKNVIFSFILPSLSFALSLFIIIVNFKGLDIRTQPEAVFHIVKQFFVFNVTTVVLIITAMITRTLKKRM